MTAVSGRQEEHCQVRDPVLGHACALVRLPPVHVAELEAAIAGSEAQCIALARMLVLGAEQA